MTPREERAAVEAAWERAEACPRGYPDHHLTWVISLGGIRFTRACIPERNTAPTEAEAWHAAHLYTVDRQRQIAEVKARMDWLTSIENDDTPNAEFNGIMTMLQEKLADLQKGMKP